jgi:hypothetical protein
VLDHLDHPGDLGVPVLVVLAVRLHLPQRLSQRLAVGGGVPMVEVFVVAENEARGVDGELKVQVGPG